MTKDSGRHYRFAFRGIKLDPYRIFAVYGITHAAQQHAIKKLLRAGNGEKLLIQDINEAIDSLNRWKEMIAEDMHVKETEASKANQQPIRGY